MKFISIILISSIPTLMGFRLNLRANESVDPMLLQIQKDMQALVAEANKDVIKKKRSPNLIRGFISQGLAPNEMESKRYLRLAGASYCPNDALNKWVCGHCKLLSSIKFISVVEDVKYQTKALIGIDISKKEIIISFRGSSNLKNWFQNAKFVRTDLLKDNPDIEVHSGFKQCRDALSPLYTKALKEVIIKNPGFTITVVGHSLGGAIATLAILDIKNQLNIPFTNMRLITFEQPRVGNQKFAEWFNKNVLDSTRFTNNKDPVPRLPSSALGFVHQHTEVYINGMTAKVCSNTIMEDKSCIASSLPSVLNGFEDHTSVWGLQFGKGCA